MTFNPLKAISPIDGRYQYQTQVLSPYFSEFGLIYYRVLVEVEYFIALCELPLPNLEKLSLEQLNSVKDIVKNFSEQDAEWIKEKEKITNHDVKAVEYFLKEKFSQIGLDQQKEFIHFGLTSQDINNTAIPLSMKSAMEEQIIPLINLVLNKINDLAHEWKEVPMLAKTHGQPASPTMLGKEIYVFKERLEKQIEMLKAIPFGAKFGGATGNFNAHYVAYPEIDWISFSNDFVNNTLGLSRSQTTTQIEHYDYLAAQCDNFKRIDNILMDLCRDFWQYVSMNYFKQKIKEGEIGSSAMPHKVNPIDFENAEGNLGIANAIFEHLAGKLPISRLQRDLTDSTVLRNIGVPMSHVIIALNSLKKGLDKIQLNQAALNYDLEENWAVVAEGIQTVLRRIGFDQPYEELKKLTRKNEKITQKSIQDFIETLDVKDDVKDELLNISPFNYTGIQLIK
jgi:adenylosuccinate lyase